LPRANLASRDGSIAGALCACSFVKKAAVNEATQQRLLACNQLDDHGAVQSAVVVLKLNNWVKKTSDRDLKWHIFGLFFVLVFGFVF
jgi:hypothetical protein